MTFCIDLDDKKMSPEIGGNKAYMLSKVADAALVPKGIVVSTDAYRHFVKMNDLEQSIDASITHYLNKTIRAKECSIRIKEMFLRASIERDTMLKIRKRMAVLNAPFAVRSSSTVEDSENLSFAGLFDTFLYVNPEDIEKGIKKVYASVFNQRSIDYAYGRGVDLRNIEMAVIIQEMIIGDKFGVGFYFDDSQKNRVAILESVVADPCGVTGGRLTPDTYIVRDKEIHKYPARINISSLFEFEMSDIISLMRKLELEVFPIDVEFALKENRSYLLQVRPLTREIPIPMGEKLFSGLPASPGYACGEAVIWNKQTGLEKGKDKILLAEEIEIEDVEAIKGFGGVILEVSGLTAHAAILSREHGIPCIVGVDEITRIVKPGEKICVDGTSGRITLPDKKDFSISRKYSPIHIAPSKLECFWWRSHMLLLYPEKSHTVVYHPSLKEELREIIAQVSRRVQKPLVDGGADIWYGYAIILEMSKLNGDIYNDFLSALETVETLSPKRMSETIEMYLRKARDYYSQAAEDLKRYVQTRKSGHLGDALQTINYAFAYWRIIGYCMLYDYAENVINKNIKSKNRPAFEEYVVKMQQNERVQKVGDSIVGFVEELFGAIGEKLQIDYSRYSSEIALLSEIRRVR